MQRDSARTATSEAATSDKKVRPARAQFGSSEVPASRATQDRIDIPEFAPNLEPEGDFSPDRFLDLSLIHI